jgi:phosphoglycerate dehydrogenase-like enzyme
MRVRAVRRRPHLPVPDWVDEVLPQDRLDELLSGSDAVVLAIPHTRATRELIGGREIRLMKPTAILVNVGRGRLLHEAEVMAELKRGTIAGAALDVFRGEPLDPSSPWWDVPNVLITPHVSGVGCDYWNAVVDLFSENLRRYRRGERLLNAVDKEEGY